MAETGSDRGVTPADVLAVVVVYVPHLRGYFTDRLGVVRLSLESLIRHKPADTPLLVFDNGSCMEVRSLLAEGARRGEISYVLRSRTNIGTPAALRLILGLGIRRLIAYGDDDVFYDPGWLEAMLEVWSAFPQAGMVSGVATLDGADHAVEATLRLAREDRSIRWDGEPLLPEEWEEDWAVSTGRDPKARLELVRRTPVPRLVCAGREAYVGATHFQYLGRAEDLAACLPKAWPDSLMGNMRILDDGIDGLGRMRLSTPRRVTRHIGNAVSSRLREQARGRGFTVDEPRRPPQPTGFERRLASNTWMYGKLWVSYRRLGRLLDGEAIVPDSVAEAMQARDAR